MYCVLLDEDAVCNNTIANYGQNRIIDRKCHFQNDNCCETTLKKSLVEKSSFFAVSNQSRFEWQLWAPRLRRIIDYDLSTLSLFLERLLY